MTPGAREARVRSDARFPRPGPRPTGPVFGFGEALQLDELRRDVGHLGFDRGPLHEGQDVGQHLVAVRALGADARDPQVGQLPPVALADLGRRDLELLSDAPQQTADYLALGLERTTIWEVKG